MNHTYRLIWSHRSRSLVVVGEHARRCGKSVRGAGLVIAAILAAAIFPASSASAGPAGGVIMNGAEVNRITRPDAKTTVITQASPRLAINWTSFSSAEGETIRFEQPNASAIALNRVTGRTPSELLGNLTATGQVFVINPNGVLFGPKASVNVGGLLASTLDMKSESFLNGSQTLEGGGSGAVINKATLTASQGGYIVLAGPSVSNEGIISAVQGKVLMAAGDKVTLTLNNNSLTRYTIDRGSLNALVQNSGSISASDGEVILTASAANDIGRAVINHTGIIEATSLKGTPGKIRLQGAGEADLVVAGKLNASASVGRGGSVVVSAARVNIAKDNLFNVEGAGGNGDWSNISRDFLIAEGDGPQTSSSIGAKTLSAKLNTGEQTLANPNLGTGTGNLYVNAAVNWDINSKLTLTASRNIYINADIKTSTGKLQLQYGQAGSSTSPTSPGYFLGNGAKVYLPDGDNFLVSPSNKFGAVPYKVIRACHQLSQITAAARWMAPRKLRAVLS
jgi:filamentous hemagglutinin family protein